MANKLYEEESIQAIADAIRENAPESTGDTTYTVAEMPAGIATVREEGYQAGYSLGRSEAGSTEAIIDVVELPTENINEDVFYRLVTGTFYGAGMELPYWTCNVVEELPSVGTTATTDMENFILYYETTSGSVSGYVDEALGSQMGASVGWYPISVIASVLGASWWGIYYNEADLPKDNGDELSLLLGFELYQYKGAWHKVGDDDSGNLGVGWLGTGLGAEIFNSTGNIANGDCSHAEGYLTTASGRVSHAEGEGCSAQGNFSHAEGMNTSANGDCSHSEGQDTAALGLGSHAEGCWTTANGEYQHVQGKYNIKDTENKYAHIVGNGEGTLSNAHTLDWNGVGWFAGDVKVGGTGQDDPNAQTLATKEYVDSLFANIANAEEASF